MIKNLVLLSLFALSLAGCGAARFSAPQLAPAASGPSVDIFAPGARVRQVIAQRAVRRGTQVVANDPRGVVLERALPQTSPVLEASCGPHQPGRRIRIELLTDERPGVTQVTERRLVLDGGGVCPVRLNAADIDEANRSLNELKQQVETGRLASR